MQEKNVESKPLVSQGAWIYISIAYVTWRQGEKRCRECIYNNLCLHYPSMVWEAWELRFCLIWNRDISVGVWHFQRYESWPLKTTILALQLCGSWRGIIISDYCIKPDVKKQDVRPVWKMIDKYFELPVCMLEEMKFWEQTKSLGYT